MGTACLSTEIVSGPFYKEVKQGGTPGGQVDILLKGKGKAGGAYPMLRVQSERKFSCQVVFILDQRVELLYW